MSTTTPIPTRTRLGPPVISLTSATVTPFSFPPGAPSISGSTVSPSNGPGGGGGGGGGNRGRNTASNASLYLYTFLATLILLLSVSAAIVARSFILRRRHRRMVEEAIRNGTWLPSQDDDDINGAVGGRFGGTRRAGGRVDLSKRPKMWDVHLGIGCIGDSGGFSSEKQASYGSLVKGSWKLGDVMEEWDAIKPVSVSYVSASPLLAGKPAATPTVSASAVIEGSTLMNSEGQRDGNGEVQRNMLRRAGTFVADLFRPPRHHDLGNSTIVRAPNVPGVSEEQGNGDEHSGGTGMGFERGSTVRVTVLIAMPCPPSDARHNNAPDPNPNLSSGSHSHTHASSSSLPRPHIQSHTHPLSPSATPPLPCPSIDESPLPVLELGIADVLMTAGVEHGEHGEAEEGRVPGKCAKDFDARDSLSLGEDAGVGGGGGLDGVAAAGASTVARVD